jgi:phage-related protein
MAYHLWYNKNRVSYEGKRIPAVFYHAESGAKPAREWLLALDKHDRFLIGADIKTIEFGWPIGMPVCRPLGGGLYEVRTNLKNRIARVIFCFSDGKMILLHGFIKKDRQTPKPDLDIARKRKQDMEAQK